MGRKNFRLMDPFDKEGMFGNIWEEWDSLSSSVKQAIEERYERNKNYCAIIKLKKGTYGDD